MTATVVLPTYNESRNLESLVTQLMACDSVARAVIVDDDSPDGTGAIADALEAQYRDRVYALHRYSMEGTARRPATVWPAHWISERM